jgi:DNA polymerase-3 subunit gamma/tau
VLHEVRGQDHVVSFFTQILTTGKIGHAYLFSGGRGTGKTSVARIIARELGTSPEDIYEIDAASNRGIEEVRALRDGVHTMPFSSRYKVYILDEAHMLTAPAANALLKTLEEPPAHCIFILATTDKQKLPATILSRCQVLEFKRATTSILSELVRDITMQEGRSMELDVSEAIAKQGDGSYRDTLTILEKVLHSTSDSHITLQSVQQLLGKPSGMLACTMIELAVEGRVSEALEASHTLSEHSSPTDAMELIILKLRQSLLLRFDTSGTYRQKLETTMQAEEIALLHKIGTHTKKPITGNTLIEVITLYELLAKSGKNQEGVIELAVLTIAGVQ